MSVKELFNIEGKIALITGGSRGLGLQMAEALGDCGRPSPRCVLRKPRSYAGVLIFLGLFQCRRLAWWPCARQAAPCPRR